MNPLSRLLTTFSTKCAVSCIGGALPLKTATKGMNVARFISPSQRSWPARLHERKPIAAKSPVSFSLKRPVEQSNQLAKKIFLPKEKVISSIDQDRQAAVCLNIRNLNFSLQSDLSDAFLLTKVGGRFVFQVFSDDSSVQAAVSLVAKKEKWCSYFEGISSSKEAEIEEATLQAGFLVMRKHCSEKKATFYNAREFSLFAKERIPHCKCVPEELQEQFIYDLQLQICEPLNQKKKTLSCTYTQVEYQAYKLLSL